MPKIKTISGIKQEQNKTWSIDTKITAKDGTKKHINKRGFETYKDAAEYLTKTKEELENKCEKKTLFDSLIEDYLGVRKMLVSKSTLYNEDCLIRTYFIPYFKGKKVDDVFNQKTIKNWYDIIVNNKNLSKERKSTAVSKMKQIVDFAWNHEYIDSVAHQQCSVVLYSIPLDQTKKEKVIWTKEEENRFLEVVKENNTRDYLFFSLLLNTGLRISEFLGLQVKCFDYENNKLVIKQQIIFERGYGYVLTDTLKSRSSYRNVVLSKSLSEMLYNHIQFFRLKDEDFIVFIRNKKVPTTCNYIKFKLNEYCKLANVRRITPHSFRHSQALKLAAICDTTEKLEIAAKRMGHTPSMFINTYANHSTDEQQEMLMSIIYDEDE